MLVVSGLFERSGFDKVAVWYHILPEFRAEIRATKRATIISISLIVVHLFPGKLEQEKKAIHSIGLEQHYTQPSIIGHYLWTTWRHDKGGKTES